MCVCEGICVCNGKIIVKWMLGDEECIHQENCCSGGLLRCQNVVSIIVAVEPKFRDW